MIIESIFIIFMILCGIGVIYNLYMLRRNKSTYRLLEDILNEARKDNSKIAISIKVCRKYSYSQILHSFRTIESFRKELFEDLEEFVKEQKSEVGK